MRIILAILALALPSCRGFVTSLSLGLSHGETRADVTINFTGKKVVPTK